MVNPNRSDTISQVERLNVITRHFKRQANLYQELYDKGGQHPKDLEVARTYDYVNLILTTAFPELEGIKI